MCRGSTALYDYTLDWMASGVQHPEDPARATLVLQGVPGAGKGIFAIIYGGLFGRHFLHLMNRDHLVGKFNAHAAEACQFFADEALFVGDARDQDILKTLTSERTKMIERKGIDAITVRSYARLILASNHVHVLRIDPEDRRYCFYDFYTPADMIGAAGAAKRRSYFVPILDQMKNGGSAALMDMLLGRDVSNFNPEDIPQTKGLLEQKLLSAPAGDQLIIEIAQNAVLPGALMSNNSAARSHLDNNRAGLLDHMRINGGKTLDAMSDKALGNILAGWDFVNVRTRDGKVWIAPALPALRDKIAAKYPAVEWDRTPEWGGEPKEE
jgi:hypothetical protein